MRRLPSDRELLADFAACAESDSGEQELQRLLLAHGPRLAPLLGETEGQLQSLCQSALPTRLAGVRALLERARQRRAASRADQLRNLSQAAAFMLARLARFDHDHVELDGRIVLGGLLADRNTKFVRLAIEGYEPVILRVAKLRDVGRALRFPDVRCLMERDGFRFTWRNGGGWLRLHDQMVGREDRERVLRVEVARPAPAWPAATATDYERSLRPAALLGDVLADIGFFV